MSDVDQYIARFNPEIRTRLLTIRDIAQQAFRDADEKLHYGSPAFAKNEKVFMFYGAYKAHSSICVGYDWVDFLKQQFPQYSYTQATIIFPHKEPFPQEIVRVICDLLKQGHGGTAGCS